MKATNWVKLEKGLHTYLILMDKFKTTDVSTDVNFQRSFKGLYRVRRGQAFCEKYFSLLEVNKHNHSVSFEYVLKELLAFGNIEASFSSKLLATINPNLPVWDTVVLGNIKTSLRPMVTVGDKVKDTVQKYNAIVDYYEKTLSSEYGIQMVKGFNDRFPSTPLTDLKKLDLILWQTREPDLSGAAAYDGLRLSTNVITHS